MEVKYGNGYLGLLPHIRRRGPRGSKLPEATWELITEFIENDYETLKQKKKYEVWSVLKNVCDKRAVVAPSYKIFARAVRRRSGYRQTLTEGAPRCLHGRTILLGTFSVSAKKLADFLESVEAEEAMLVQRLRDAEGRKVTEKINGGTAAATAKDLPVVRSAQGSVDIAPEEFSSADQTETLEIYEEF